MVYQRLEELNEHEGYWLLIIAIGITANDLFVHVRASE